MRRKYGNKKVVCPMTGYTFDSKAEHARFLVLFQMRRDGQIDRLARQITFELAPSVVINGRKRPPLKYIADFVYTKDGHQMVEDVKGFITPEYRIKRHLMKSVHG